MKAKSYKLKYVPTAEQLINLGFQMGGTWIKNDAKWYKWTWFEYKNAELSINICFSDDTSEWNDFDNVLVLDEDFGQPYTAFYFDNYKKDITDFPALEYCIEKYNEFMDSFDFLEEDTNFNHYQ